MAHVLYYSPRSPYARKVRILLIEKAILCELQEVDPHVKQPEFLQISPLGRVPVFVDDNGTTLWDSTLIMEYLDELYPIPAFYPSHSRWRCRQWEELADTLGDSIVGLWSEQRDGKHANPDRQARYQSTITRLLTVLEQQIISSHYVFDKTFTAVDAAVVSFLDYYSLRFGEAWQQQYPQLHQWISRLYERESVRSTAPS
jgi:glutathione S-transferase